MTNDKHNRPKGRFCSLQAIEAVGGLSSATAQYVLGILSVRGLWPLTSNIPNTSASAGRRHVRAGAH